MSIRMCMRSFAGGLRKQFSLLLLATAVLLPVCLAQLSDQNAPVLPHQNPRKVAMPPASLNRGVAAPAPVQQVVESPESAEQTPAPVAEASASAATTVTVDAGAISASHQPQHLRGCLGYDRPACRVDCCALRSPERAWRCSASIRFCSLRSALAGRRRRRGLAGRRPPRLAGRRRRFCPNSIDSRRENGSAGPPSTRTTWLLSWRMK